MTKEQTELAKRLVACEQWRWIPGMLPVEDSQDNPRCTHGFIEMGYGGGFLGHDFYPNISDHATAAILLRMAMDEWGRKSAYGMVIHGPDKVNPVTGLETDEDFDDPDLGTAAAQALLHIWEEK